jgi:hypothetical protein
VPGWGELCRVRVQETPIEVENKEQYLNNSILGHILQRIYVLDSVIRICVRGLCHCPKTTAADCFKDLEVAGHKFPF